MKIPSNCIRVSHFIYLLLSLFFPRPFIAVSQGLSMYTTLCAQTKKSTKRINLCKQTPVKFQKYYHCIEYINMFFLIILLLSYSQSQQYKH